MKYLILATIAFCIASCSTNKHLQKGNVIYTYTSGTAPDGTPVDQYTPYEVTEGKRVEIVDNGTYLIIRDDPAADSKHYKAGAGGLIPLSEMTAWKREAGKKGYFTEGSNITGRKSLWYADEKFVLQTASIPIKIRSRIRDVAYKDSFPSFVETGVNIGFLFGGKKTWNRYRTSANILGQKTDKYSITGGVIFSTGAADLSTATTRPKIEFPRKEFMISYGVAVVVGLNSINLGYAFGWDRPIGSKGDTWLYDRKLWNGIIVSLDLIK